ncbi:MAG: glucose-6-phosphate isomerase [Pseudomonadota bacterium]
MRQPALTESLAYADLRTHHAAASTWNMRDLFAADPRRFTDFSLEAAGLFLDYSKNHVSRETMAMLCALAQERGVAQLRDRMFAGEKINITEQRAVLHVALRAPKNCGVMVDGRDVNADVHAVLDQISAFAERVRSGEWVGATGKPVKTVVNIGIGGSFLGPKMAYHALRTSCHPDLAFHFVSNVDANELEALLPQLDPHTTLFIVASKTFGTAETMLNAHAARAWTVAHCGAESPARHFVAVSTNLEAVLEFGINEANMFGFWEWVGGRYSVWSAVGLALMLAIGPSGFKAFLAGAHAMDRHFQEAPLERNMPVVMAMLGVWYRNFFGCGSLSIAPYWQDLQYLPGYLQQLDMESNGKRVTRDGAAVQTSTAPVIWGDVGTNGQHAYFQLLHQGTEAVPVDFITVLREPATLGKHHTALLANCLAQSAALMRGKTEDEARAELRAASGEAQYIAEDEAALEAAIEALVPHKTFPGNRPSNTLLLPAMTPAALGALIALYEHKTFVQGVIWDVNSFDQWGVELGKALAKDVETALTAPSQPLHAVHDSSTAGLIERIRAAR